MRSWFDDSDDLPIHEASSFHNETMTQRVGTNSWGMLLSGSNRKLEPKNRKPKGAFRQEEVNAYLEFRSAWFKNAGTPDGFIEAETTIYRATLGMSPSQAHALHGTGGDIDRFPSDIRAALQCQWLVNWQVISGLTTTRNNPRIADREMLSCIEVSSLDQGSLIHNHFPRFQNRG